MLRKYVFVLANVLTLSLASHLAFSDDFSSGTIAGHITDESGSGVAEATVSARSLSKNIKRTVTTGVQGSYRINLLPIGTYELIVTSRGHTSTRVADVLVNLGAATAINLSLSSRSTGAMEEVVVTASRVQGQDFETTTIGSVFDVVQMNDRMPLRRDVTSLALLAPGTVRGDLAFGSLPSIGGSSVGENTILINGLNVTDFRNFVDSTRLPYDFIEQTEVKTGGFNAEFGRATGGVMNSVSRSGGDEWEFGLTQFWSPDSLTEQASNTYLQANKHDERDLTTTSVFVGGPIWPGHLYGFVNYERRDKEYANGTISELGDDRLYVDKSDDPRYAAKLDWIIVDGHTLEYTYFTDESFDQRLTYNFNGNTGEKGAFIGTTTYEEGGENQIVRYTGVLPYGLTVSALWGENEFHRTTFGTTDANPAIYESRAAFGGCCTPLGNWGALQVSLGDDKREVLRVDVDLFVDDLFGTGTHHFRIGYDQEELTATDATIYSGGHYYRYYDPDGFLDDGASVGDIVVRDRQYLSGGEFTTNQEAWYIQDSWQVNDRLTLNIGFRDEVFDNRNANGDTFIKLDDQVAPRLAFTFDPTGNGTSKLYGSYGEYYLPVATNTNLRMAGAEFFTAAYYIVDSINPDDSPVLGDELTSRFTLYGDGDIAEVAELVDENLEPMYQEEYILGFAGEFGDLPVVAGWKYNVRYIYRDLVTTLEDVAIDAAVLAYCIDEGIVGCDDVWTGFHQYVLTNPGNDMVVSTIDLPGTDGALTKMYLSAADLNYPRAKRSYKALEIEVERPFDGKWFMRANYTYSKSRGNYEGSVKSDNGQDDAGLTQDFDQPGLTDGSNGYLPNDRRHKLKVYGSYQFGENLTVGGSLDVSSPRRFGCIGYHPTDNFAFDYAASSWYCDGQLTPRGSADESDWIKTLDLSVIYSVPVTSRFTLQARMDIFNVFDWDAIADINEVGESGGIGDLDANFGKPTRFQTPRTIRLGLSIRM